MHAARAALPAEATGPTFAAVTDPLDRLAREALRPDPGARQALVRAVGGVQRRAAARVLGAAHPDLEDVTQDAAMAFLASLPAFRGGCTVAHFAARIAHLTAVSARRKLTVRSARTPSVTPDALDGVPADGTPHESALGEARRRALEALVDDLSPLLAESLLRHVLLGHTTKQIAATARIPVNTVWSRLRLAKAALRRRLEQDAALRDALAAE